MAHLAGGADDGPLVLPPLPAYILSVLGRAAFCYLATVEETSGATVSPHLCLMRFTWVEEAAREAGGCIIVSTRRDSRKFIALSRNKNVAVLVHDDSAMSVTIYGDAEVCDGEDGERMRALHLQRNPAYAQFIADRQKIAIVRVHVRACRTADVHDRVHDVVAGGAATASS